MRSTHSDPSPVLRVLQLEQPLLWVNPSQRPVSRGLRGLPYGRTDIDDAAARLDRFAPLLVELFPELKASQGIIESELIRVRSFPKALQARGNIRVEGKTFVKADHALPVAGSVKARGGIYAVLKLAETLALDAGRLTDGDDYRGLATMDSQSFFNQFHLTTTSTGNLGLSIGIMGAALGFKVTIHMSREAKAWKKKRLRDRGVAVVEHAGDYTEAGAGAREAAARDERTHFIDDENSVDLFLGYSVAALRLAGQLKAAGVRVDQAHPLFVYIPCGVGGAPGGITFGLKHVLGEGVHSFFAEPTQAPCMLVGLLTGKRSDISIYDVGLELKTQADGLAVSRVSELVATMMTPLVSGCFTVSDADMLHYLRDLEASEGIQVEPSAAAGCAGPVMLLRTQVGRDYLDRHGLLPHLADATHIIWTTGGLFVPREERQTWREGGEG